MRPRRSASAAERPRQPPAAGCEEERCITCADIALELRVIAVDDRRGLALCEDRAGRRETVETALVAPVDAGDELLVHAGTAIRHLGRAQVQGSRSS